MTNGGEPLTTDDSALSTCLSHRSHSMFQYRLRHQHMLDLAADKNTKMVALIDTSTNTILARLLLTPVQSNPSLGYYVAYREDGVKILGPSTMAYLEHFAYEFGVSHGIKLYEGHNYSDRLAPFQPSAITDKMRCARAGDSRFTLFPQIMEPEKGTTSKRTLTATDKTNSTPPAPKKTP
jgi:hypothetical protein